MNNPGFGKTMENVRKNREIKLATTERRRSYLISKPSSNTTKFFTENLLVIEMKTTVILINKPVHLGLSILELSQILIYEFSYHYIKHKYGKKVKLCHMGTCSFTVYKKTDYVSKDIGEDVETRFDTSN